MLPLVNPPAQAAPQRQGLLGGLFSPDNRDRFKRLAIGLEGMTMNPNRGLMSMLQGDLDKRQADQDTNKTVAWLKSLGTAQGNKAAAALESGSIDAATAVQMGMAVDPNAADLKTEGIANRTVATLRAMGTPQAMQAADALAAGTIDPATAWKFATDKDPAAKPTDDIAEFNLAKQQGFPGNFMEYQATKTPPPDNRTELQKRVEYFMGPAFKMTPEDALKQAQAGSGGTTVNVGPTGTDYGAAPTNMAWMRNPDGSVKTDKDGMPMAGIIGGTPAAIDAANASAAASSKTKIAGVYSDAAIGAIDSLIGADGKPGMLGDQGLFSLPQSGIIGSKLADWGLNQEAVDVKNTLDTITSNIAFGRLQAMRDASKTGGALGGVSERELDLLANSLSAVKQNTSPERLIANLKIIKEIWQKIGNDPIASAAYAAAGGAGGAGGAGASAAPAPAGDGFAVTGSN